MQNKITITLLAAISKDGFLADSNGNGDFSSQADKMHLRSFLRSNACDCFISGRKTAEEFKERLTYKPLFILSSTDHTNKDNIHYINGIDDYTATKWTQFIATCLAWWCANL